MESKWVNVCGCRRKDYFWNKFGECVSCMTENLSVVFLKSRRDSTTHTNNPDVCNVRPISQCWKSGCWSSPERLLWEWGSISSVTIYTAPTSIERRNEARSSQQSGQGTEGFHGSKSHFHCKICECIPPLQQRPESIQPFQNCFCMEVYGGQNIYFASDCRWNYI